MSTEGNTIGFPDEWIPKEFVVSSGQSDYTNVFARATRADKRLQYETREDRHSIIHRAPEDQGTEEGTNDIRMFLFGAANIFHPTQEQGDAKIEQVFNHLFKAQGTVKKIKTLYEDLGKNTFEHEEKKIIDEQISLYLDQFFSQTIKEYSNASGNKKKLKKLDEQTSQLECIVPKDLLKEKLSALQGERLVKILYSREATRMKKKLGL